MTWSLITDAELTSGQLVLASTWKKLIDNPEAVCSGDATVPLLELILIEGQNSPVSTPTGAVLYGGAGFAEFRTTQPIGVVMPFYFWQTIGVVNWVVPSSGWYEITAQGGGGSQVLIFPPANGNFPSAASGGSIRIHKLLNAGEVLSLTVGAGAGSGTASPSIVTGSDFSIVACASPNKPYATTVPPLSGVNSYSGLLTLIQDQPLQLATMYGNQILSSSAVGYAYNSGIIMIERFADNGL